MLVFREIKPDLLQSSCVALGVFDGVHLGHQKVILDAVKKSNTVNAMSAIVTFARHPQIVFSSKEIKLITSLEQRLELFKSLGIQAVVVLDFNEEMAKMSAEDYLEKILINAVNAKSITIGYNHHFGAKKRGTIEFLKHNQEKYGYEINVIPPVSIDNKVVSSSVIRNLVLNGDVSTASKLLGRPFSFSGVVVKGMQRGRLLGFPTANIEILQEMLAPATGVYSGIVEIEGQTFYTMINVGKRPTFGDLEKDLIEAHIIDFNGDLYNKTLKIDFLSKIRDEQKFNSIEELKIQLQKDCEKVTFYRI